MSSNSSPDIPPTLRDRLRDENAEGPTDLEAMWELLGAVDWSDESAPDLQAEWDALAARRPDVVPESDRDVGPPSPNGRPAAERTASRRRSRRPAASPDRTARRRWTWAAAAVLALVVLGGWLWRQPVTVSARPGQQRTATLPDGSTVELNSGTTLTYRRRFQAWPLVDAERRAVRLEGEAFFRVEEGGRPFVVETATAQVTVTGTRFNVRAHPGPDSTTRVTIAEGRVEVASRQASTRSVTLDRRGQRTHIRGSRAAPSAPESADIDLALAWRQDGFGVSEQPLTAVLRELERRYDTPLRLHESVRRTTAPVSLYYPTPTDLSVILGDLCTALNLNYRPTSRGYEIFSAPDRR